MKKERGFIRESQDSWASVLPIKQEKKNDLSLRASSLGKSFSRHMMQGTGVRKRPWMIS